MRAGVTRRAPPTLVINFIYTLRNAQGRTCSPEPPASARLIRSVIIIILHASDTRREIFQFNCSHWLRQMQPERIESRGIARRDVRTHAAACVQFGYY